MAERKPRYILNCYIWSPQQKLYPVYEEYAGQLIFSSKMKRIFISSFCLLFSTMTLFKVNVACSCGDNGLTVHLPFAIRRGDDDIGQRMVMGKFFVKHIDYIRQEIQLRSTLDCLLLNASDISYVDMPRSPLYSPVSDTVDVTLFRCPTERVFKYGGVVAIPCLGDTTTFRIYAVSYLYEIGYHPELESCTKMYDVFSVPATMFLNVRLLKWSKPNCSECKVQGKKCRLNNNGTQSEVECVLSRKPSKANIYLSLIT